MGLVSRGEITNFFVSRVDPQRAGSAGYVVGSEFNNGIDGAVASTTVEFFRIVLCPLGSKKGGNLAIGVLFFLEPLLVVAGVLGVFFLGIAVAFCVLTQRNQAV